MSEKEEPMAQVARATASRINPAIADGGVAATLEQVADALGVLSMYVATAEAIDRDSFSLLKDMLATALLYEAAQQRTKPEAHEAPVKRVK